MIIHSCVFLSMPRHAQQNVVATIRNNPITSIGVGTNGNSTGSNHSGRHLMRSLLLMININQNRLESKRMCVRRCKISRYNIRGATIIFQNKSRVTVKLPFHDQQRNTLNIVRTFAIKVMQRHLFLNKSFERALIHCRRTF